MRSIALGLTLMMYAFPGMAQTGAPGESKAASQTAVASTLNGNWQITGNREQRLFPLISMAIHVNGKEVTANGNEFIFCSPGASGYGGGGSMSWKGEIEADGNFTLRTLDLLHRMTYGITVSGKAPEAGSTRWIGHYRIKGQPVHITARPSDCMLDETDVFTASPLRPLTGTFYGEVIGSAYGMTPRLKVTLTATQGDLVTHERKRGLPPYRYLPLTGAIHVQGSSCFADGKADASMYSFMQGDLARMKFEMDDGSELSLTMVYTNPDGSSLSLQGGQVSGGECDRQPWRGTLSRQ